MAKHVFLSVLGLTLLALVAGVYLSSLGDSPTDSAGFEHGAYPWQIEILPSGYTRVFSLTVGQSSLKDAEQLFKEMAEITLFIPIKNESESQTTTSSVAVVEAYFSSVKTAGLKAKMVMSMDVPSSAIDAMYARGVRISTSDSGIRKVTLSDEDAKKVRASPIASITYLPSINLQAALIEKRFGVPTEKLADSDSDAIHWLYPARGVDIALSESSKEVIQYTIPSKFEALVRPLRAGK